MREIHTEIEIGACAERVWQVLTDFAAYPEWNPLVRRIRGDPKVGSRLRIHVRVADGLGTTFRALVLNAEPARELRWRGRFPLPGLFQGEHIFLIQPSGTNSARFIQREVFSGLLAPVILLGWEGRTRRGFEAMNRALKARAEKAPAC